MSLWNALVYNPTERRLRMVWRLLGQALLFLLIGLVVSVGLGILLVAAGGSAALEALSTGDPLSLLSGPTLTMATSVTTALALLASVWVAARILDRRRLADFGLRLDREWWVDLGFGLSLGAFLMLLVFLVQWALGWIVVTDTFHLGIEGSFVPLMLAYLVGFVAVGVYEEVLSRGYHLTNLAQGLRGWLGPTGGLLAGALISAALFGVLHLGNPFASVISTLNIALAGLLFALGYILTGRLGIAVGLHISWNYAQGNIFGFPVSGLQVHNVTLIATEPVGPELVTGGAFGPEAGLVGLGAVLLGMALTVLWVRWREGPATNGGLRLREEIGALREV